MDKNKFRVVIKHFHLKQWMATQIKAELAEVHGDWVPSLKTVYYCINKFKRGRTSIQDETRYGRPIEITTSDMLQKIHNTVKEDHQFKVREIVEAIDISTDRVHRILHKNSRSRTCV